jgi:putative ABC transport system ATP-binding protein
MIQIQELSKVYNGGKKTVTALQDVAAFIGKGEFVSIVGPSGSGKTTLLLCLGGLIQPTRGKVLIGGESVYDQKIRRRALFRLKNIGFVFQGFNLIPYLTALENVEVPLALAGMDADAQTDRAVALLSRLGLEDRLHHKPSELSIGQQQRVAIARALANEPNIILADEPTGNLDPESTGETVRYLKALNETGITVVMVTHNPEVAHSTGRTLRLVDGRLMTGMN